MKKMQTIEGVEFQLGPELGDGGQGTTFRATAARDKTASFALKMFDHSKEMEQRTKAIVDLNLAGISPFIAGPILSGCEDQKILHVAPLADGVPLKDDSPRSFAGNLEVAHHYACQNAALEQKGYSHGDHSDSNFLVRSDGATYLIDLDNIIVGQPNFPDPPMVGQAIMLAPELQSKTQKPDCYSDRFAFAILMNMILLKRHPSDGLTSTPRERKALMSKGIWPERARKLTRGDVPIAAMGTKLQSLFDQAFLTEPTRRPSMDQWRRALLAGLNTLVLHECGQTFILDDGQTICPWCAKTLILPDTSLTLKLTIKATGIRYRIPLRSGQPLIIGKVNITHLSPAVSRQHLELGLSGNLITLKTLGRNGSQIWRNGKWEGLGEERLARNTLNQPLHLRLADVAVKLEREA